MPESTATAPPAQSVEQLSIDAIRVLSMDAVQKADSGHPGTPMALAPLAYVLWTRHLRYNPRNPNWMNRDRFVLSAGHASMLLYSVLYLTGYELSLDDLKQFRQWESSTPGHPELGYTPGVETTTGPLGQGVGNSIGMAVAEAQLAAIFNRPGHGIIDHRTYFIASDGDMMEGVSHEASSFAGHLKLGKIIGFYDDNHITIEGDTALTFSDETAKRYEAYGWHTQRVEDANDLDALDAAIVAAKAVTDKPSLIVVRSHIGYGSPHKIDTAEAHGSPLGTDEIRLTKEALEYPSLEPFYVAPEALEHWRQMSDRGVELENDWQEKYDAYEAAHPDDAAELERRLKGDLLEGWEDLIPSFTSENGSVASRAASGIVLNAIAPKVPELVGGSADLASSTNTIVKDAAHFAADSYSGRNFHFGVREHGMAAVMNGMSVHGGFIPYGATFLIFSDYMRPSVRLACLMNIPSIFVYTHDSVFLGEDGPTHQPVEHYWALRLIPNMTFFRPGSAAEVAMAWAWAVWKAKGPTAIALTRQKLDPLPAPSDPRAVWRGAYVLDGYADGEITFIATGSELPLAVKTAGLLRGEGVRARVVSAPCLDLFDRQPVDYQSEVLGDRSRMVAIEAGRSDGWNKYVNHDALIIGIDRFGASAPYEQIAEHLGFTPEKVAQRVRDWRKQV